jgi:hypothetical protein
MYADAMHWTVLCGQPTFINIIFSHPNLFNAQGGDDVSMCVIGAVGCEKGLQGERDEN